MEVTMNLLPPQIKDELRERNNIGVAIKLAILLLVGLIVFMIFLSAVIFIISIESNSLEKNIQQMISSGSSKIIHETKVRVENYYGDISKIEKSLQDRLIYSDILIEINQLTPKGVFFQQLKINGNILSIKGLAKTRADLLEMQRNLESRFEKVDIPISNFTSSENATFEINIDLKTKKTK